MQLDRMKCAVQVLCKSAPVQTSTYRYVQVRTSTYWYVLVCTIYDIPVPACTVIKHTILYLFGNSGTALYHLVLACTNRGILVLAGTGTDWYVPVQTSTFQFACLRSGVQDSRCCAYPVFATLCNYHDALHAISGLLIQSLLSVG
jgi:hypothetical protein